MRARPLALEVMDADSGFVLGTAMVKGLHRALRQGRPAAQFWDMSAPAPPRALGPRATNEPPLLRTNAPRCARQGSHQQAGASRLASARGGAGRGGLTRRGGFVGLCAQLRLRARLSGGRERGDGRADAPARDNPGGAGGRAARGARRARAASGLSPPPPLLFSLPRTLLY